MLMRAACLPGLSIAVVQGGVLSWTKTFGVVSAATKEPMKEDTLFEAASISKPVFAYAVLQLADANKIDLDRPLVSYFKPSYFPESDAYIQEITARHVLTHSTGLPNWGDDKKPESLKPTFKPGTGFNYSGEGFFWLQMVVEKITGLGLDAFVRSYLFQPAGMLHTTFAGDLENLPAMAFGHRSGKVAADQGWRGSVTRYDAIARKWNKGIRDWTQQDFVRAELEKNPSKPAMRIGYSNSAGSLLTTASDYARFVCLMMPHKQADWEVTDKQRQSMISPLVAVQKDVPVWWGLGWSVESTPGGLLFDHEGNNENRFTSYAGGNAETGDGIVILANGGSGFSIYQRVLRATLGFDLVSFLADLNPPHDT